MSGPISLRQLPADRTCPQFSLRSSVWAVLDFDSAFLSIEPHGTSVPASAVLLVYDDPLNLAVPGYQHTPDYLCTDTTDKASRLNLLHSHL